MNRVCSLRTMLFVLLALLCASVAFAQSDLGSISGYVRDQTGASVPNAKVTVRNTTGLERVVNSNESGYYIVTNIPPGVYTVIAESTGFKRFESTNNRLEVSSSLSVDASLTVGAATEVVEVVATAPVLQTETATVQRNINRQQIDALEMNGRNPVDMARLVPGTRSGNLANTGFGMSQGPSNINGARTQESIITYDGAPAVRTRSNGSGIGAADVDSTQEVQVLTSNYAAEYGRAAGGQIRILTRSGTSDFHGAGYEYFRNSALNANTWSRNHTPDIPGFIPNSTVAPFRFNQFGYNFGGPFYIPNKFNREKNKYFFYWGQEWVRNRFTDTLSMTVPSTLMRQGNFSELLDPANKYYGKAVQLNDPDTGTPFAGNIIPANRLSPSGIGILRAYPLPNIPGFVNGNTNYYRTAGPPAGPAQRYIVG